MYKNWHSNIHRIEYQWRCRAPYTRPERVTRTFECSSEDDRSPCDSDETGLTPVDWEHRGRPLVKRGRIPAISKPWNANIKSSGSPNSDTVRLTEFERLLTSSVGVETGTLEDDCHSSIKLIARVLRSWTSDLSKLIACRLRWNRRPQLVDTM